jgi:hypothetical protein
MCLEYLTTHGCITIEHCDLQLNSEIVAGQSCERIAFTLSLMSLLSKGLVIKQSLSKSLIKSESVSLK